MLGFRNLLQIQVYRLSRHRSSGVLVYAEDLNLGVFSPKCYRTGMRLNEIPNGESKEKGAKVQYWGVSTLEVEQKGQLQ